MRHDEYAAHDATGLAQLIRDREVTASEVLDAALARADAVNPALNAVVHRMDEVARESAAGDLPDGPFAGVPFMVKDMDGFLAGEPWTMSSRAFADYVPSHDSEHFTRFREAGLIFAGKTNCPELGIMGVTESEFRGPARNPWNLGHTPGGSSGGSGAAVAAGIVPVAHAGDGGGSIRIPASACGLFGFKPSRGLLPLGPDESEPWSGLVVRHVISRSVRDSAAILDATAGADIGAPYWGPQQEGPYLADVTRTPGALRIGISTASMMGRTTGDECVRAVTETAELLTSLGHDVVELDLPIDREELANAYLVVMSAGIGAIIADVERMTGRKPKADMFELPTWFLKQVSDTMTARELEGARQVIGRVTRRLGHLFTDQIDVHVTPTMAHPPVKVFELAPSHQERAALAALRRMPMAPGVVLRKALDQLAANSFEKTANTMLYNMTGQPAMSVPLHWTPDGLPVGLQFAASYGADGLLFQLAGQLEEAKPWQPKLAAGPLLADLKPVA